MFLGAQPVRNVLIYTTLLVVFGIGHVLKSINLMKGPISKGFNKLVGVCLPPELYWDSLFSWEMLEDVWRSIQIDLNKKVKRGKRAFNTPVILLDENNNEMRTSLLLDHANSERPLVLNSGSYSCPVFRACLAEFRDLVENFADVADFAVVYIEEAHPSDGWAFQSNVVIPRHYSHEDRCDAARLLVASHNPGCPILVDTMLDASCIAYGATPIRFHVILNRVVVYEGGPGPMMYNINEVKDWLENFRMNS